MITNNIKKIIVGGLTCCGLAVGLSSCTDFLTIYPTDRIVGENFWKTKSDVDQMVDGCYQSMLSADVQTRAIIWGAYRSDELVKLSDYNNTTLDNISALNLLPTMDYCSWESYYKVINNCNIVLNHAPDVMELDPEFTQGDYEVVCAQMKALRSLCYFYLVRAFRDVPYVTHSVEDDTQVETLPQSTPAEVLQHCIDDLKEARQYIMKSGGYGQNDWRNWGYITTDAVDAASEDSSSKNLTPGAKLSDIRDGGEDKEYAIAGEFIENGYNDNTLSHTRGVISMFRKSYTQYQQEIAMMRMMGYDDYLNSMINKMYDSQSSAFFILTQDNTGYDGTYAAFGKVIEGMDVVDKISQTELQKTTDENGEETVSSKPVNVPIIKNVTVETYGVDYGEPETMEVFDFDAIFNSIMQMYMQSQSTTTSY